VLGPLVDSPASCVNSSSAAPPRVDSSSVTSPPGRGAPPWSSCLLGCSSSSRPSEADSSTSTGAGGSPLSSSCAERTSSCAAGTSWKASDFAASTLRRLSLRPPAFLLLLGFILIRKEKEKTAYYNTVAGGYAEDRRLTCAALTKWSAKHADFNWVLRLSCLPDLPTQQIGAPLPSSNHPWPTLATNSLLCSLLPLR